MTRLLAGLVVSLAFVFAHQACAAEKGIFDYEKQRAAGDNIKKIVFIGDAGTHGPPGNTSL